MSTSLRFVFASAILVLGAAAQRGKDDLSNSFARWFRDFQAGRIDPNDFQRASRKPYLTKRMAQEAMLESGAGRYTRMDEARFLFRKLKKRGKKEDGERFLKLIATSLKKKGGKFWEANGRLTKMRTAAIRILSRDRCPPVILSALVDRVQAGFPAGAQGPDSDATGPLPHKEAELATIVLPVLSATKDASLRRLFEDCLRVQHSGLQAAAANSLAVLGHGRSITAVARALNTTDYPDDVSVLATSIRKLVAAKKPAPKEKELKFTLNIAVDRFEALDDWRSRLALLPVLRSIRSRGTIPVLIGFLEQANTKLGKDGKAGKPFSGTLMSAAQKVLVDLTGYYADMRQPEKWRTWWDSVKDSFVLAPVRDKKQEKGGTQAQGFFGIPVTGNRVVFVFDVSGSMQWPYEVPTTTGAVPKGDGLESRLDRAKRELLKATSEMTPDSKFNVVFFSSPDLVRTWKKRLVWANKGNKKALKTYLKGLNADGGTAIYDALDAAMKIKLDKKKETPYGSTVDEIFLLSDGSPTMAKDPEFTNTDRILEVVRTWNNGAQVRINTIFIGDAKIDELYAPPNTRSRLPGNMPPEKFMKRLADENDGKFVEPRKG